MNAFPIFDSCAVDCCDKRLIASVSELAVWESEDVEGWREREIMMFCRSFKGRKRGGMLSQVLRPIITVFVA